MIETLLSAETARNIEFNLHQVPAAMGLAIPDAAGAAILGIGEAEFVAYTAAIRAEVEATAAQLLTQSWASDGVDALRALLPNQGTVMTVGDSITTYRRGYAELLRAMLAQRYPGDGIRLLNVAQSGYTTTHARESVYTQWILQQPDVVFVMYGVNDCKHFGEPEARTLVAPDEYRENLDAIIDAFRSYTAAHVLLMTPTPIVEQAVNSYPDFAAARMTWYNSDIRARARATQSLARKYDLECVDLWSALGAEPDPALYLPDGLHPGSAGEQLILKQLLATLQGGEQ